MGDIAKSSVEAVSKAAHDENYTARVEASRTLWKITGEKGEAAKIAMSVLGQPEFEIPAIQLLGELASADTVGELLKKMETDDESILEAAAVGLGNIANWKTMRKRFCVTQCAKRSAKSKRNRLTASTR
jgi:hypothetical protein